MTLENVAADLTLAGTITTPRGEGPFPGVVLVSGAGAQDRDGAMFGHRPLLVLADHLTREGIAVLRFDDRGVGGSGGSLDRATPEHVASDARAAVEFLTRRSSVDPERVGVIGHSDGALAAALAARGSDAVAFLVMLAGPGLPGAETVGPQAERIGAASGLPGEIVAMNRRLYEGLARIVVDTLDTEQRLARMRATARDIIDRLPAELRERVFGGAIDPVIERMVRAFDTPWTRFTLRRSDVGGTTASRPASWPGSITSCRRRTRGFRRRLRGSSRRWPPWRSRW